MVPTRPAQPRPPWVRAPQGAGPAAAGSAAGAAGAAGATAPGSTSALGLAALLAAAGATHLLRPGVYEALIPPRLGAPRPWVVGSGVAELACAAALLQPRTRRSGALASAALFVVVFPGNVQMALDARRGARGSARRPAVAWGRLPLQVPLVLWARHVARTTPQRRRAD